MQLASSTTLLGSILCVALTACTPPDTVEITARRVDPHGGDRAVPGATSADRFGGGSMGSGTVGGSGSSAAQSGEAPLEWDTPEGWKSLPKSEMRIANLQPAGHPDAECSLIILPGDGGGLLANLNRWRGQMGQPDLDDAAVLGLPKIPLLGMPATEIQIEGDYSGMGSTAQPGFALHGVVLPSEQFTVFVKMTGPSAVVAAEANAFLRFCASIRGRSSGDEGQHSADDGHDHSSHAPGEHGASDAGATPAVVAAAPDADAPHYEVPVGWRNVGPDGMRIVNLQIGEDSQCYVIELFGEAGGELANLNRWRGEVGLDPMTEAESAALERIQMFGAPCPLLEVTGDYSGMGGSAGEGRRVLATLKISPTDSVFVKMVGPNAEVSGQREQFIAFCASLEMAD